MAAPAKNKLSPVKTKFNLWEVKLVGTGGNIPNELKGSYTSEVEAQEAINSFQRKVASRVKK